MKHDQIIYDSLFGITKIQMHLRQDKIFNTNNL